ncbi:MULTISPECIES: 50S ribosomal protein L32 [Dethiosulfovibrio]|jgi:large subunit ribosomal protein L32|uniref:Large ribosomal subunit protein bL32 n=2 Tax=Dethiosulfovibrio TaxID=47054 RepID=A0ABS9ENV8_9BACT|nr:MULTISPECIES: 50S ribosomal protein L32 [Dethiosulfovibrio]MEA3284226.1 50S ribosomal protein L32 [Synergistota bacterium]MCF4113491.1 50S ribosomal protein L32 [Dethiosulfovibrio russensis]MCF4141961.1 50S ribosomal protein L32 [Dethiosulfovibrio marinus]MCF4144116.1 50S ribosomal protein L32 [Dethiosulfovibrio acidaminovorans]MCF4150339.1 50S ribosomal protein L32 [Dethiosulfovibrio faecalis]
MATPKSRVSHRRTHNRKAQWLGRLETPGLTACPHCGETIQNYHACPECGYYRGRKAIEVAADKEA